MKVRRRLRSFTFAAVVDFAVFDRHNHEKWQKGGKLCHGLKTTVKDAVIAWTVVR